MDNSERAKKIVSNLLEKNAGTLTKTAAIEKQVPLDLFRNPVEDQVGIDPEAGSTDSDLFGQGKEQDKEDRDKSDMPEKPENTDETEEDTPDTDEIPQGEDANRDADPHYSGSGEGKEIRKG